MRNKTPQKKGKQTTRQNNSEKHKSDTVEQISISGDCWPAVDIALPARQNPTCVFSKQRCFRVESLPLCFFIPVWLPFANSRGASWSDFFDTG